MTTGKEGTLSGREERPHDQWVVGIVLGEHDKAYYYLALTRDVSSMMSSALIRWPCMLIRKSATYMLYLRQVGGQVLTLALDETGQHLVDAETNTKWDIARGLAREGELQGEALLLVPYLSSYDWAWQDFHPNSEFYR